MKFKELREDYKKVIKMFRDNDWKKIVTKHRKAIDDFRSGKSDLPKKVEDDLLVWAMNNNEAPTKDQADDFIQKVLDENYLNESVEEITSVLEKAYDQNDVKKVQQLEKKLQGMLKEVEKTMKGSGLSAPAFNNVRSGIVKGLDSIKKFYKVANNSKAESIDEKYKSKYPSSLVAAAVKIAIDMGGNMTGAYKKIEKMKKGLADDSMVKDALRQANESVNLEVTEGKDENEVSQAIKLAAQAESGRDKKDYLEISKLIKGSKYEAARAYIAKLDTVVLEDLVDIIMQYDKVFKKMYPKVRPGSFMARFAREDVNEAMSDKDKKKRLALIKKAVEKINKKNADMAKKDALKMMKDSGMFDESVNEGVYTKNDGGAFDGLRIAKWLAHEDGKSWRKLGYGDTEGYLQDAAALLKKDKSKARDILSQPTPRD